MITDEKNLIEPKRIKLWIAFLPLSPFLLYGNILIKWGKFGLIGFNQQWAKLLFTMIAMVFVPQVLMVLGFIWLFSRIQSIFLIVLCGYVYLTVISLIMREVEYRQFKKLCESVLSR